MISCDKLDFNDTDLIKDKIQHRSEGHLPSAKSKSRGKTTVTTSNAQVGEIVYLYGDRDKSRSREKYIVIEITGDYAWVQKLTNNQIRARKYRVKLSDIITVQVAPHHEPHPESDQC